MKVNQIRAGAILSYLSMGLGIVISLVYTPVMVDCLGSSEYAVYNLVLPIISYLSLMSLGLGSAYVRYYSRYKEAGDKRNMAKLNGMFLVTYSVLAAALLIAVFAKIDSYWGCLLWGLVFVAVYAGSMWLFGLNRFERGLVSGVARKLFGKRERRA